MRLEWFDGKTWQAAAIDRDWSETRRVTRVPIRLVNIDTGAVVREYYPTRH